VRDLAEIVGGAFVLLIAMYAVTLWVFTFGAMR